MSATFSGSDGLASGSVRASMRDRYGAFVRLQRRRLEMIAHREDPEPDPAVLILGTGAGNTQSRNIEIDYVALGQSLACPIISIPIGWPAPPMESAHRLIKVNFAELPSGTHRFEAAIFERLRTGRPHAYVEFEIIPPFWRRCVPHARGRSPSLPRPLDCTDQGFSRPCNWSVFEHGLRRIYMTIWSQPHSDRDSSGSSREN